MKYIKVQNRIFVISMIYPRIFGYSLVMVETDYFQPFNHYFFFYQGGATLIFESLIYNLLGDKSTVSYANTGHWSEKAIKEAVYNAKGLKNFILKI